MLARAKLNNGMEGIYIVHMQRPEPAQWPELDTIYLYSRKSHSSIRADCYAH